MTDWSDQTQQWWCDDEVLERITRAYVRDDNQFKKCPRCGDIAQQQSIRADGDVVRELRCTNCSHMERTTVVETSKTAVEVTEFPFKCQVSVLNSTGEELAAWLLWYDQFQEEKECR